jgi:hypothetical protein
MAGLKFTTDLDAESLYKVAFRKAQDLGYTVREAGPAAFTAQMGNVATSVLTGAYCDFRLSVMEYDDGNELVLERNAAWWTGTIGVSRVKSRAKDLMKSVKDEIAHRGGKILGEKEI